MHMPGVGKAALIKSLGATVNSVVFTDAQSKFFVANSIRLRRCALACGAADQRREATVSIGHPEISSILPYVIFSGLAPALEEITWSSSKTQ
jgi:hypothetical protein